MDDQVVLECTTCHDSVTWALALVPENATLADMAQGFFDAHAHSTYGFTVEVASL